MSRRCLSTAAKVSHQATTTIPSTAATVTPSTSTHTVFNQARPLVDYNLYDSDPALKRSLKEFMPDSSTASQTLATFGVSCGSASNLEHADLAEKNRPQLRQFDNYGRRIDVAEYHPSYHALMAHGLEHGCASYGFNNSGTVKGAHVVRAGLIYMENQLEAGHCCPIVMTSACVPVLKKNKEYGCNYWLSKVLVEGYDPSNKPIEEKTAATIGMSMTEKQGGT
jgi:putative acyl-CoA dehydrogenase